MHPDDLKYNAEIIQDEGFERWLAEYGWGEASRCPEFMELHKQYRNAVKNLKNFVQSELDKNNIDIDIVHF